MRTMAISTFKTNALKIVDEISKSHEHIIITKRGKAVAELSPFRSSPNEAIPGKLASALVEEKDIVSPLGSALWEACE
jgi:antitoxin (DNA-binding transcriptional repressor) of toxin-antitoxin stability system